MEAEGLSSTCAHVLLSLGISVPGPGQKASTGAWLSEASCLRKERELADRAVRIVT